MHIQAATQGGAAEDAGVGRTLATRATLDAACMMPGAAVVVRDKAWRMVWCSDTLARYYGACPDSMKGTDMYAVMPADCAEERMRLLQPVLQRGARVQYVSICQGRRSITTALPLDPASFGHEGFLAVIAPATSEQDGRGLPVCAAPMLALGMEKLSRAELCVAYFFARRMDTAQIGERLSRSRHTIDDHIKAIHRKLGVSRQVELATVLATTGIAGFTEAEWCHVTGVNIPNPAAV